MIGKKYQKLNLDFIDIDKKIEESENNTISDIFKKGESYFREIEKNISINYLRLKNKIVSLGGGGYINVSIENNVLKTVQPFG